MLQIKSRKMTSAERQAAAHKAWVFAGIGFVIVGVSACLLLGEFNERSLYMGILGVLMTVISLPLAIRFERQEIAEKFTKGQNS